MAQGKEIGVVAAGTSNEIRVRLIGRFVLLVNADGESIGLSAEQADTLASLLREAKQRAESG